MISTQPIPIERLIEIASEAFNDGGGVKGKRNKHKARDGNRFDMAAFISRHGIRVRQQKEWSSNPGGFIWELETCFFNPEHDKGSACLTLSPDGKPGFKCQHAGCAGKGITDVFALFGSSESAKDLPWIKANNRLLPKITMGSIKRAAGIEQASSTFCSECVDRQSD